MLLQQAYPIMSTHLKDIDVRYQIRTATWADMQRVYAIAQAEGWNPGERDANAAAVGMPGAFWVGLLDGEVIASMAAARYGDDLAYLSFYLVKSEFRRQGYGAPLWRSALESLGSRNLIFDAMPNQVGFYQQLGFKIAHSISSYHFNRDVAVVLPSQLPLCRLDSDILEEVLTYDSAFFPADRKSYMREWLSMPNASGWVWKEQGKIQGYGLIRKALKGYRIGPCYAENPELAFHLIQAMLSQANGEEVSISMPDSSSLSSYLLNRFDLTVGSQLQRMYSRTPIDLPLERIAGITSFTFG